MFGWLCPLHRGAKSKQSKRRSKRGRGASKRTRAPIANKENAGWSHVNPDEEEEILELRSQGLSTAEIANGLGRSTRTINTILRQHGMNGRQNPAPPVAEAGPFDDDEAEPTPRGRRGKQIPESFLERMYEFAGDRLDPYLEEHPEVVEALAYGALKRKPPLRTIESELDRWFLQEAEENPAIRKKISDWKLDQMLHKGRSDMEIFEEGMEQFIKFTQLVHDMQKDWPKDSWPKAVEEIAKSGEVSKTLVQALGLLRGQTQASPVRPVPLNGVPEVPKSEPKASGVSVPPEQGMPSGGDGSHPQPTPGKAGFAWGQGLNVQETPMEDSPGEQATDAPSGSDGSSDLSTANGAGDGLGS